MAGAAGVDGAAGKAVEDVVEEVVAGVEGAVVVVEKEEAANVLCVELNLTSPAIARKALLPSRATVSDGRGSGLRRVKYLYPIAPCHTKRIVTL